MISRFTTVKKWGVEVAYGRSCIRVVSIQKWPESMILTLSINLLGNIQIGSDLLKPSHSNTCKFMDRSIVSREVKSPHKLEPELQPYTVQTRARATALMNSQSLVLEKKQPKE